MTLGSIEESQSEQSDEVLPHQVPLMPPALGSCDDDSAGRDSYVAVPGSLSMYSLIVGAVSGADRSVRYGKMRRDEVTLGAGNASNNFGTKRKGFGRRTLSARSCGSPSTRSKRAAMPCRRLSSQSAPETRGSRARSRSR
jgi:hypothetical protein